MAPRDRVRPPVHRGRGSLQVYDDDRESECFVCGEKRQVRFIQFNAGGIANHAAGKEPNRMFLRICRGCLGALFVECEALAIQDWDHSTDQPE